MICARGADIHRRVRTRTEQFFHAQDFYPRIFFGPSRDVASVRNLRRNSTFKMHAKVGARSPRLEAV